MSTKYPEELQLSLQRLGIPPNYPNTKMVTKFDSPGKGVGIKSVVHIPRGTPILSDWHYIAITDDTNLGHMQAEDETFRGLICPPLGAQDSRDEPTRRFDANSFAMGRNRRGIFLEASRFNHSCRPNAHAAWNYKSRRLTVHAIVEIPINTEIFLNYRTEDYSEPSIQRQEKLRGTYGFVCTCEACDPNTAFGMASRDRRSRMRILDQSIDRGQDPGLPLQNQNQPQVRNQVFANLKSVGLLLEMEGLFYPQLADVYGKAITWYRIEMDLAENGVESARYQSRGPKESLRSEALEFARQKLDCDVACNGHNSPEVLRTLKLIETLKEE